MKIFAAGIATETNTFCPIPTALEDFRVQRGGGAPCHPIDPSLDLSDPWGRQAEDRGDEFVFSLMAYADPAGLTVRSAYESLRDEILRDLKEALPVDVVLLMLHGAMVAHGYEDCEEDIIQRVRALLGPESVIGVEFDLHCNLSESKIRAADLVITYKEYPHIDPRDRARELFELAIATRLGQIRPTMVLFDCHMVGRYPTSRQPLRSFVDSLYDAEKRKEVLSISFAHGFQFSDLPHTGAKLLAITDNDPRLAQEAAREYGLKVYALRRQIGTDSFSLPLEQAFARAPTKRGRPVVLADQCDNPGGGAPGDATFVLRWLLEHHIDGAALAFFHDPEVLKICKRAGTGAALPVRIGGKLGPASGDPVDLTVTVVGILEDYQQLFPQQSGTAERILQGDVVALRSDGIDLIVTNGRGQCLSPTVFSDLGIDPMTKRFLILKSAQHFYAAFAPMTDEVIYLSTPGALPSDPRRLSYKRMTTRERYPWTDDPLGP